MPFKVCFTGHRPNKLGGYDEKHELNMWVKKQLEIFITSAYKHGCTEFITGGALGVDTWAAEQVLLFYIDDVDLTVALPCTKHDVKWPESSQKRYHNILSLSDRIMLVTGPRHLLSYDDFKSRYDKNLYPYTDTCMQARNEWMVNNADMVIAVWDGTPGGTGNCVKYAMAQGKKIYQINPKTRKVTLSSKTLNK